MAAFEPGVDQPLPNRRELFHPGAEQVDPLRPCELDIQPEVTSHLRQDGELGWCDLTAGYPRHHRIGTVTLNVGEHVVIGVL